MGVCNCSMFCCTLLYVHFSIAIILMGKRELIALLNLSSLCLVMVEWLFLAVPRGCLQFVIVVFPDHTHLLFLYNDVLYIHTGFAAIMSSAFLTKLFLCPQRNCRRHIVIALSIPPSISPSVSPSVRPASCPVHIFYIL